MPPVALVACAELRRRRGSLAVLALLTTVVVATVLATLAGARRTTTVLDRFRHETAARDLEVTVSSPEFVPQRLQSTSCAAASNPSTACSRCQR